MSKSGRYWTTTVALMVTAAARDTCSSAGSPAPRSAGLSAAAPDNVAALDVAQTDSSR